MSEQAVTSLFDASVEAKDETPTLDQRKTPEIVIALVGPVGSGVSTTAKILETIFKNEFKYTIKNIHVSSDIIATNSHLSGEKFDENAKGSARISSLQLIGSKLRQKFSDGYLADKCVERIALDRASDGYDKSDNEILMPKPLRVVHIHRLHKTSCRI